MIFFKQYLITLIFIVITVSGAKKNKQKKEIDPEEVQLISKD